MPKIVTKVGKVPKELFSKNKSPPLQVREGFCFVILPWHRAIVAGDNSPTIVAAAAFHN